MLDNYCDLEKKQIDSSFNSSLNSNFNSNDTDTASSSHNDSPDYQNYIQQQKELIRQIHKQESKLKQFNKMNSMSSTFTFQNKSKLKNTMRQSVQNLYSPPNNFNSILPNNTSNFLLKPIKSDYSPNTKMPYFKIRYIFRINDFKTREK